MAVTENAPKDSQRSPILLIIILLIVVLGIASFLILRPRGTDATNQSKPAAAAAH